MYNDELLQSSLAACLFHWYSNGSLNVLTMYQSFAMGSHLLLLSSSILICIKERVRVLWGILLERIIKFLESLIWEVNPQSMRWLDDECWRKTGSTVGSLVATGRNHIFSEEKKNEEEGKIRWTWLTHLSCYCCNRDISSHTEEIREGKQESTHCVYEIILYRPVYNK